MAQTSVPRSKAKTAYGLLSDVCKAILREPKRYDQSWWLYKKSRNSGNGKPMEGYPACGTVGCVAGWVVTLKGVSATFKTTSVKARTILGLDEITADELFDASSVDFEPQTQEHAVAGVEHIRAFQREHARQLKAKRV